MEVTLIKILQSVRGIAAIAVAAYHLTFSMPGKPLEWLTQRGYLGVDLFFVLSGFIILHVHAADVGVPSAWSSYIRKRIARVYPLYWAVTIAMIAGGVIGAGHKRIPTAWVDWITTLSLIRFSDYLAPLPPAWTLYHEIAFYLIFSILVVNRRIGMAFFVIWASLILLLFSYPDHDHPTFLGTFLGAYNLNFIFGMSAYLACDRLAPRAAKGILVLGVLAFFVLAYADVSGYWTNALRPGYGVSLAAMLAGAVRLEKLSNGLRLGVLVFLGDASYSIYLMHESLESRCQKWITQLVGTHAPVSLTYSIILVTAVLVACVLHQVVEKPLLSGCRTLLLPRPVIGK
jgi:peptidoglycan/LPS O-acetylase OafA/YrhL